jgi:hypothetical protein
VGEEEQHEVGDAVEVGHTELVRWESGSSGPHRSSENSERETTRRPSTEQPIAVQRPHASPVLDFTSCSRLQDRHCGRRQVRLKDKAKAQIAEKSMECSTNRTAIAAASVAGASRRSAWRKGEASLNQSHGWSMLAAPICIGRREALCFHLVCFLNWTGVELGPLHTSVHWFQSMAGVRSLVLEASILHFCSVFVLLVGPLPFLYKKFVIELSATNLSTNANRSLV